ncbi:SRPBCC family protein [Actinacidiphila yeochonensis]|uniref:SRPBCC family protein n=1 Tax=Actinacidiphila yeochonensis TaxID=89050 RepID=UPI000562552D|nr:SRPBCC family protein [Actinacidiphila yeochonensis]
MDWNHYRFHCSWRVDADPGAVHEVLARADRYPEWWPQVRGIRRTGETTAVLRLRSLLPYDLVVTASSLRDDPRTGVLEVALSGDLEGWARWTVRPGPRAAGRTSPSTVLDYEQEVAVTKPLMRVLAPPCRPLFRANHALMMRSCRAGLRARLAAARHPV